MTFRALSALVCLMIPVGCAAPLSPTWSVNQVVNTADGAVVIWRRAVYEGGEFNGFDRNPVQISRAAYRAFKTTQIGETLKSAQMPIEFAYRKGEAATPDPKYVLVQSQVMVSDCTPENPPAAVEDDHVSCSDGARPHIAFRQLGGRGELVLSQDDELVFVGTNGRPDCRLRLDKIGSNTTTPYLDDIGSARFGIVYFPLLSMVYVVDHASDELALYGSSQCENLRYIGSAGAMVFARGRGETSPTRSLSVLDIVPTKDPFRPVLLMGWTEAADGIFRERFGVFGMNGRDRNVLPADIAIPIGFWRGRADHVLVGVEGDVAGSDGHVTLTTYDVIAARTYVQRTRNLLR